MARQSKEEQARISGLQRGLEIAEKEGIEGLREEVNFRCKTKIPLAWDRKDLGDAMQEIQDNMLSTVLLMSVYCLRQKFDFTEDDIDEFSKIYIENSKQLLVKDLNWPDIKEAMEEELGFKCKLDDYFMNYK
jgi:hypothetical protein